jgi:hypothetical protein
MNPYKAWKMTASVVFIALLSVLFAYSGRAPERALAHESATILLPLDHAPAARAGPGRDAEPPSNEVGDLQQLD